MCWHELKYIYSRSTNLHQSRFTENYELNMTVAKMLVEGEQTTKVRDVCIKIYINAICEKQKGSSQQCWIKV